MKNWEIQNDETIVCYCNNINKGKIIESINKGNISLEQIRIDTKACTNGNCKIKNPSGKCCSNDILKIIEIYKNKTTLGR